MLVNQTQNQQNFQGKYILKGSVPELGQFDKLIRDIYKINKPYTIKINNKLISIDHFEKRNPAVFSDLEELCLTGQYSEKQDYAENLYTTNNDTAALRKYFVSKDKVETNSFNKNISITELIEQLQTQLSEINAELKPVENAIVEKDHGNSNSISDIYIDLWQKARNRIIKIFGEKESQEVQILDVKDVLESIKNGSFDFVNGKIN
jgi:hypothetical protein